MKKKIIIFSSTGGGGHISVASALTTYLENNYIIKTVYPFEILNSLDFFHTFTFGRYTAEKVYNIFVQKHLFFFVNIIYYIGKRYIKVKKKSIQKLFSDFLEKEKPDLIISVIPVINGEILTVAQKRNIPFLVIPTDLDATTFIYGIHNPTYEKFHITIAFDIPEILNTIKNHVSAHYLSIIGFPLRPDFFKTYDIEAVKKKYKIPEKKMVILCMLGAIGSKTITTFLKQMRTIENPCHLIICLGKSEYLKEKIKNITFPEHISITILGFTQKVAELMAISDLFFTKSGTVSVVEALYMNLPMLIDATSTVLKWEQFNHTLVEKYGFGTILHNKRKISQIIDYFLQNPHKLKEYQQNIKNFEKKFFDEHIKILVHTIMDGKRNHILKFMYDFL